MSRHSRGAAWAAVRLLLVLGALAAFAAWWRLEQRPDWFVDRRLPLLPVERGTPAPAADLGGRLRDALELPCGRTLRFEFGVPGDDPVLRFAAGHVTAHPELAVRLGDGRELLRAPTRENDWETWRVPLPAGAGERVTVELAALDGRGRPGLGAVYVADVVLESGGRGVDVKQLPIAARATELDLLAAHGGELANAPRTPESARIGLEGPQAVPLAEGAPFFGVIEAVPAQARLDLVVHVGRPWPEAPEGVATLELLADGEPLASLRAGLRPEGDAAPLPAARELSASVDLGRFAGRRLELELRRRGAPALWLGLREAVVSAPRSVSRRTFTPGRGRNVLLLLVDSLRPDRLGAAGWPGAHTPVIDSLAARGGRWTRVLAPSSWSLPNVASLLTGVSPLTHGLGVRPRVRLSPGLPTLAQSAAWSGYTTALFSATPVTGPQFGLDRGFERAEVLRLPAEALAERALDWLEDAQQFEWFLALHATDPSYPHEPSLRDLRALPPGPPAPLVERLRALDSRPGAAEAMAFEVGSRHDAEIAGVDRALGLVVDWLAARDLLRSTLVVVVGTSGEEFFEHRGRMHGQTLWDEVVTVPLVMAGPGIRGPDGGPFVEDEPVSLLDVTRLLGEYGRLAVKSGMQGRLPPPFGPLLPEPVFHALLRPLPGVTAADLDASRTRRWLRLFDHASGRAALFDLAADPAAACDLLAEPGLDEERGAEVALQAEALRVSHAEWVRVSLLTSAAQAEPAPLELP